MLETKLTETESGYARNEHQEIEISSTLVPEAYTIQVNSQDTNGTTGAGVVQSIVVRSASPSPFSLSLYGANTVMIDFGASASVVQQALNDMPMMYPNLATVTEEMDAGDLFFTLWGFVDIPFDSSHSLKRNMLLSNFLFKSFKIPKKELTKNFDFSFFRLFRL